MAFIHKHASKADDVLQLNEIGLSVREISQRTGVSIATVSRYINGKHLPASVLIDKCKSCKHFDEDSQECRHQHSFELGLTRNAYMSAEYMRTTKNKHACHKIGRFYEPRVNGGES